MDTSVNKNATHTIATVHISRPKVVQRLRCEAVCFILAVTGVIEAVVRKFWNQQMAC
jgi:hypothetical protein